MERKQFNLSLTEKEKVLLDVVSTAQGLSRTKLIVKVIEEEAMRTIGLLDDNEEINLWLELIEQVKTERKERDEQWKKDCAERLERGRSSRKKMTRKQREDSHRKSARDYYRRKKLLREKEEAIKNGFNIA